MGVSDAGLRAARCGAQLLGPREPRDPVEIVRRLVVVQSQDPLAASLGLRARGTGFAAEDVERLRAGERALVRTWLHRGTIQLVATEDLGWLRALLAPSVARGTASRWKALGLDDGTWARARRVLCLELSHGPLTRGEIRDRLRAGGVDASGQRLPHLLLRAALEGLVCDGPDQDGERTHVLEADWVRPPGGPAGERAAAELARRYLGGHGPASIEDFAWWSGLSRGAARAALAALGDEVTEVRAGGRRLAALAGRRRPAAARGVRLLPAFDSYLVGYKDRSHALDGAGARAVLAGGMIKPLVVRAGTGVGTWLPRRRAGTLDVVVGPFVGVRLAGTGAEVADVHRYLGASPA